MLNNEKIKIMTRLAAYEKSEGKEDIKLSRFYRTDYIRYQILQSVISVTIGYFLILIMIIIYQSEYLISNAVTLDYKTIGVYVLSIYIMLLVVYSLCIIIGHSIRFSKSRGKLNGYYQDLKKLNRYYRDNEKKF